MDLALTEQTRVQAHALRMLLRGQLRKVLMIGYADHAPECTPGVRKCFSHLHRSLENRERIRRAVWPDASDPELWAASEEATGRPSTGCSTGANARSALAVALEGEASLGRSLSAERDQRVGAQAPGVGLFVVMSVTPRQ